MKIKNLIIISSLILIIWLILYFFYDSFLMSTPQIFYKTEKIKKRDIHQNIYATGKLELKNNIKVGSLVAGTIQEILVNENDKVKKGQLLAKIDNGKSNTQVRRTEGELKKAKANLEYQKEYYFRQKELYKAKQISKNQFELVDRDYQQSIADVIVKQADLDKEKIEFNNTNITAPESGIIVSVGITIGEKITTDLDATILFEIAKDIQQMEATLNIDECDIGQILKEQKVSFCVGTYPEKKFHSYINNIGYSPHNKNGVLTYLAYFEVTNKDYLLRPGMTVNATIKVAKAKNSFSISAQAFQVTKPDIDALAQKLNYKIIQLSNKKNELKSVWIVENNSLIEKAVKTNINDNNYFEIQAGLKETDNIITEINIEEDNSNNKFYSKMLKNVPNI